MIYTKKKTTQSTASKLTYTAIFAALTCILTMIIKIPVPATQGYIHFGDIFVMLSGLFVGPGYGMIAAGAGSALADLFSGYALYAPVTLAIKALCALTVSVTFRALSKRFDKKIPSLIIAGVLFTAVLTGGYLVFELLIYGNAAFLEVPMNIIQGASGVAGACALYNIFSRIAARNLH